MSAEKKVKLSDFIKIKHGFAFKGNFITTVENNNCLLTPGNFAIGGGFKSGKFKYFTGNIPTEYILKENDLIVTMTDLSRRGDTLGYSALVPNIKGKIMLHNQRIGLVEFLSDELDKEYLYFLLRSNNYRNHILGSATGSTVKHTSPTKITSFSFSKPKLEIQKKIATHLMSIEKKIQLNNATNQTLEAIAQALFKSWFIDFDPVKAKIAALDALSPGERAGMRGQHLANQAAMTAISGKNTDELDELQQNHPEQYAELLATAKLFPSEMQDSELGQIPLGWEVKPLDKIAHYQNGLALQKFRPEVGEGYLPIVKIAQLKSGQATHEERAKSDIKPGCIIDDGDVVFSWSGSLLVDIWCGGKAALNQHLFKVTSEIYPKWFYYYFTKHHLSEFQRIASAKAVTMGHIKREHLKQALCIIPNEEFFDKGYNYIGDLLSRQIAQRLENQNLASLRDTLLPKLLSGEYILSSKVSGNTLPIRKKRKTNNTFKEAILIAKLTGELSNDKYPLGRKRYTKFSYLFHRKCRNEVKQQYLKKAAGPYNPSTRYKGPEKIAQENCYIKEVTIGKYAGFIKSSNYHKIDDYFQRYWRNDIFTWLLKEFRYKTNEELELLATVDRAMLDIIDSGNDVSLTTVKKILISEPEWQAKLDKDIFSDKNIRQAINYLIQQFSYE